MYGLCSMRHVFAFYSALLHHDWPLYVKNKNIRLGATNSLDFEVLSIEFSINSEHAINDLKYKIDHGVAINRDITSTKALN